MLVDLFAGLPVTGYERSLAWYERFLGSEPSFLPNATEAVCEGNEIGLAGAPLSAGSS